MHWLSRTESGSAESQPPCTVPRRLYCRSAGEHSKTQRPLLAGTGEMPNVAIIDGGGSLPCKARRTVSSPLAVLTMAGYER